ncbi:TPA: hypothetical protein ACJJUP_000282, partial [Neisseria meningitidis]
GVWVELGGVMGQKQLKTCVWVSAVGRERNFAKVPAYENYHLKEIMDAVINHIPVCRRKMHTL